MNCENYLCLYWKNNNCILEDVSLNICGQCIDCMYINFKEEDLEKIREIQLEMLEERHK